MKVIMMGITPPEQGGSQGHISEISKINKNALLTQKGSELKGDITEIPVLHSSIFSRNISFAVFSIPEIFKMLFVKKYDIIHIHESFLYPLIPILRTRYKVVTTVHGCKGFKFFDNKLLWKFFSCCLKFSNKIIAVSKPDQALLKNYFSNVEYIPNGVDNSLYSKRSIVENKIVFIGRIHPQKGIIYLLKAFNEVSKKYPNLELEIIGKGEKDYESSLKKSFLNKNISWKGYINDKKEIVKELQSAYLICIPSLWEGLPLTLFESLASGRPVVASDLELFRSITTKGIIFFKPENSDELAQKISLLVKDKEKADKIGAKGKEVAREYDWKVIAKKINNIYNTL